MGDSSSFSVYLDAEDSPAPLGQGQTGQGRISSRAGPVAEGVNSAIHPTGRTGNARRTVSVVFGSLLFLVALCAVVGYFVFADPTDSRRTLGDTQDTLLTDSDVASGVDGGATDSTSGTASGSDDNADLDDAEDGNASGAEDSTSANGPALAPALAPAGVVASAPGPLLESVPVDPALGTWDDVMEMPVMAVAVAVLPSGKVLMWSAETADDFAIQVDRFVVGGGGNGVTQHAVWDPVTNEATGLEISHTDHDMFCPGVTTMPNGDIIVTGGQNADVTSIYHLAENEWVSAPNMHISRGYGSSCLLSDGKVFVLGGSWSGPRDLEKDAEIYDPTAGVWSLLPGIQASFILTDDPEDANLGLFYRADNYGWFFSWSDGTVFHAGPSTTMHWFDTAGVGSALIAGTRPGGNSANGNAVMFDVGKILTCGGSEAFALPDYPATTEANLITIHEVNVQVEVKELSPMNLARVYANANVLPDGKVLITGGADTPKEFSDAFAQYAVEIWDPATEEFTVLEAEHEIPRTYHSTAVLLPDGRVFTGGGGLCGDRCAVNHLDMEIFNPPYLFNDDGTLADRPVISLSAATAAHGDSLQVTGSEQLMMVSMIRMGSATHSTNTDQRRIELCGPFTTPCSVSPVTVTVHTDPGIALAGHWMIFGVNEAGVPSEAEILLVG